ncbi:P-loop containing nucleoside triphosphate hydrolase protein, partial [Colletotrichum godetiae]
LQNTEILTVISIVGRPGSGTGTQCHLLSQEFDLSHISTGDVLREEMERGEKSPRADIVRANIVRANIVRANIVRANIVRANMLAGTIGPIAITTAVLKDRVTKMMESGIRVFILDGFPRSIEQRTYFQTVIAPITSLLLLQCSPETSHRRLLPRGRFDDQAQGIRNRLVTFETITSLVVDEFRKHKRLTVIDAEQSVEEVYEKLVTIVTSVAELLH